MLEKKIEARKALQAFHTIQACGTKTRHGYTYNGLTAETSFDGYTLIIKDQYVELFLYFHNTFKVHYQNRYHLQQFIESLDKLSA